MLYAADKLCRLVYPRMPYDSESGIFRGLVRHCFSKASKGVRQIHFAALPFSVLKYYLLSL